MEYIYIIEMDPQQRILPLVKKKIRKLKNPKLRKIRYEIRTLFYLIYRKEMLRLRSSSDPFARKRFQRYYFQCPINCWMCGTRMEDLIRDPETKFWFCVNCFKE